MSAPQFNSSVKTRVQCRECGAEFETYRFRLDEGRGRYCSRSCVARASGRNRARPSLAERFWLRVDRREPGECWPWNGSADGFGRGRLTVRGHNVCAPRVAWEITHGSPPKPDESVCHSCDNPNCVNPAHLWIGSHADNMRDAAEKGRAGGPRKTHCAHGHELTGGNLYVRPDTGERSCAACRRIRNKRRADPNYEREVA